MKHMMNFLIILLTFSMAQAEIVTPNQIISMRNDETGIKEYDYNIKDDRYSVELSYNTNLNPMMASDISGFRGQLTIFSDNYNWLGYAASSNVVLSKATNITGNFDSDIETMSFFEAGIGLGGRTGLIRNFINKANIYDEYSAIVTYSTASTAVLDNSFTGYGLVASYGLFLRTSKFMHWGVRADYHLQSLQDKTTDEFNHYELTASWISVALSAAMHF